MAKLPKFGEPESAGTQPEQSFKLPEFKAPAPVRAPKVTTPTAPKVTAPKATQPKVTPPKQTGTGGTSATVTPTNFKPAEGPVLKPIISAASAIINSIQTGIASLNGYDYAKAVENNNGVITEDDIRDASFQGRKINGQDVRVTGLKDGQPVYNIQPTVTDRSQYQAIEERRRRAAEANATAWTRGENTAMGGDVMKEWGKDTAPGFLGISEAQRIGFLRDVAYDPINLLPFGAIGAGIKAVGKGTAGAYDAMKLASRQQVSAKVAERLGLPADGTAKLASAPVSIPAKFKGIEGRALGVKEEAKTLIDDLLAYRTTQVSPTANPVVDNLAVIGSGIEAGVSAMGRSLVNSRLTSFLNKYAAQDLTILGNLRTQIIQKGANDFRILSGNGEELARATSKFGAKEEAARLKAGASAAGMATKVANDVTKALDSVEREFIVEEAAQGAPTAKLPAEAGDSASIEPYTPYNAKDGGWWVYDGEKIYKTTDKDSAERVIDALLWTEKEFVSATVTKVGRGYQVRAGEQVFPARTKAEADAIASAYNEGTLPGAVAASRGQAVVDARPTPLALADILKMPVNTQDGKALKAVLSKLDKVSSKATGVRSMYTARVKERIQDIIRNSDSIIGENKILAKVTNDQLTAIREAIAGKDSNPFALFEIDLNGLPLKSIVSNLNIPVKGEPSRKFSTVIAQYKTWKPGTPPAELKIAIESELAQLQQRIEIVKKVGAERLGPQQKYDMVKAEFGTEVADRLQETNIFADFKSADVARAAAKSFYAVIDGLLSKASEVKFSGVEDLINQVKNNRVVVDEDSLKQIFKLIDPGNSVIAKVDTAATQDANIYVYNELFKSEGVKTIRDMQVQITQMGDFGNLLNLTGISDDLLLGQMIKDLRSPEGGELTEFVVQAAAKESKQAVAERVAGADTGLQTRVLESIAEANAETFAKLQNEILPNPDAQIEVLDTFGKVVSRSTKEQYAEGSVAIQNRVFNQARQRKQFNVLVGLTRKNLTRGEKALDRQALMDETIKGMNLASDNLGLMDIRMTLVKERADQDFIGAFEKAKAAKKKFNFSTDGNFAYLHMGDVLDTFQKTGANEIVLDAFFPATLTSGKAPKNYLSTSGFLDASRQAIEMRSKGRAIDVDELTARILDGGLDPNKYSAAFKSRYKVLARQLAEHLAREDVLEGLSKAHLEKSIGVAERWVNSAESIGKDLERLLYEAWEANYARGGIDDMARVELIRSHMRKVLYVSDTFRIDGGPIAEAAIRAVSGMMLKKGLIRTPDLADDVTKLLGQEEAAAFRKIINTMYLHEKPQFAMKPGQTKFVNARESGKIQNRLVEAEENYAAVMARVDDQFSADPKVKTKFTQDRRTAQTKLDRVRETAIEAGLSTRHFSAEKGWVPTDKFNYEAESRAAQRRLLNYESAKSGLKAREDFIADSRPVMPKATILKGKRRDEFLKKENARLAELHVENAASRIRNANDGVETLMDNQHYEKLGATAEEAGEMYFQRAISDGIIANTEMPRVEVPGQAAVLLGSTRYGRKARVEEGISFMSRLSERAYGLSNSRRDVAFINRKRETEYHKITDRYANVLRAMTSVLRDVPPTVIEDAFSFIKRGEDIPAGASPELSRAYELMELAWRPLIASIENSISTQRGYNGDMLAAAMKKMGLTEDDGFISPAGLTASELPEYYKKLPFGDFVLPSGVFPDTDEARALERAFKESKEALQARRQNPLVTMLRLMQASQNVVFQKGLAEDFIAHFSYKAENFTYAQAVSKGYVELKEVFGGETLLKYLPSPENGGLFPPELAKQFFSMNREYNAMFDSVTSQTLQGAAFENMLTTIGTFKASQTILVPRHHVTNFLGDMSTAMMRGVVNPRHHGIAARLATNFATRRVGASYFIERRAANANSDVMERLFQDMFRAFGSEGRVLEGVENGRKVTGIVIYEKGKPVRKNLSDDDITNLFEDYGIIEESIYQEDIQGLVDSLDNTGMGGVDTTLGQKIAKKFREGVRVATKAPGDLAAGYGNIPRIAHALKIMHGRSWGSIDEAMAAIADEIALFHPTAKSLASGERQWGRFATTYYTWMRMAQVGMIRMIAENTREVIAVQKLMYEWNREQLGEDNRPINIGTGYGGDPNAMPSYLSSTAGVSRITGANLQTLLESTGLNTLTGDVPASLEGKELQLIFPLMYNDALNYWKADVDPYRDLESELFSGMIGPAGDGMNPGLIPILGKNISLIGDPLIKLLYGIDPATGKKVEINNLGDFGREFLSSNVGFLKPLEAATGVTLTPQGFAPSELTEEEKFLGKFRGLIGLGLMDPQTDANKQNALNQFNTRTKKNIDSIIKQQGVPKEGTALRQRLEKVAEDILREQEGKK